MTDSFLTAQQTAAAVAIPAASVLGGVLVLTRRPIPADASLARTLAVFVSATAIHAAATTLLVFMLLRGTPVAEHAQTLLVWFAGVVGAAIAWDVAMLATGSTARRLGFGTRTLDIASVAFLDGTLPMTRGDASRRLTLHVSATSVAAAATGAALISLSARGVGDADTARSVVATAAAWAWATPQLLGRVAMWMTAGRLQPALPVAPRVLRTHPDDNAPKRRILTPREAADELES